MCTKSNIFCRSVSGRRGVSTVESLRCTKYLLVSFYYLYIAYTKLCPSQCTNQRRFMTSPLVIQIYACIILHFILKFHHWQRYTWHSGVIAVYQPTPFYDFTFSDKYSSICLGWKRPKVQILSNSVSFGSLTYSKTCVLSITGALAGWEHVLIGFQHIHNRELESRNKSKLPFILPGKRNLNICTLSSLEQVQGTNPNCLLFFPTEG